LEQEENLSNQIEEEVQQLEEMYRQGIDSMESEAELLEHTLNHFIKTSEQTFSDIESFCEQ
jgi:hypothetical protein